jgi:NAD(P)H-hydrate repair Nnr-like enzyme with NAD(P)H-hydrate dehydratase domain
VLKHARTIIATPDGQALVHDSDTPGLATGGSGDVLSGIIGGLLARGAPPLVAAGWGVWLHGAAGRAAAQQVGPIGFLARDLPQHLPKLMTL